MHVRYVIRHEAVLSPLIETFIVVLQTASYYNYYYCYDPMRVFPRGHIYNARQIVD